VAPDATNPVVIIRVAEAAALAPSGRSATPASAGKSSTAVLDFLFSTLLGDIAGVPKPAGAVKGVSLHLPNDVSSSKADGGDVADDRTRMGDFPEGGDHAPDRDGKEDAAGTANEEDPLLDANAGSFPSGRVYETIPPIVELKLEENSDGTVNYEGKEWDPDQLEYYLDRRKEAGHSDPPEDPAPRDRGQAEAERFPRSSEGEEKTADGEDQAKPANEAEDREQGMNDEPIDRRQPDTKEQDRADGDVVENSIW
jgi:hypothetical protein